MAMLDNKEFEDKAWGEMLNILDNEIPEKKPIVWWRYGLLLLLIPIVGFSYTWMTKVGDDLKMSTLNSDVQEIASVSSENKLNQINNELYLEKVEFQNATILTNSENEKATNTIISKSNDSNSSSYSTHSENQIKSDEGINIINTEIKKATKNDVYKSELTNDFKDQNKSKVISNLTFSSQKEPKFSAKNYRVEFFNESTLASLNEIVAFDETENQIINYSNPIFNKIYPERTFNLAVLSKVNYYTQNIGGIEIGFSGLVGHEGSPWSFSSGLSYEKLYFSELSFRFSEIYDANKDSALDTTVAGIEDIQNTPDANRFESYSNQISASYLHIPLMFHYRINRFNLGLGISNSFLINSTAHQGSFANSAYINPEFNNYRVAFSQSVDFMITPSFIIGLDASIDLSGLKLDTGFSNDNINLNKFGFKVAYQFNLSK